MNYSVTKGSLLAIFNKEMQLNTELFPKKKKKYNLYVQLSLGVESHMSTTNISASDNQNIYSKLYNCRCW